MRLKDPQRGGEISYNTDGKGRWWKRTLALRCTEEVFFYGQCQGVKNHDGVHWCYNANGSFCWDDNEYDPKHGGCSGVTPPDHADYVSPVEMNKHLYLTNGGSWEEVTDPAEIARIEADEMFDDETVTRPITDPEEIERLEKIIEQNKLDEIEFNKGKKRE